MKREVLLKKVLQTIKENIESNELTMEELQNIIFYCNSEEELDTDILFAKKNDIHSLCVLSGISTEKLIQTCNDDIAPEYYTNSIADLLSFI